MKNNNNITKTELIKIAINEEKIVINDIKKVIENALQNYLNTSKSERATFERVTYILDEINAFLDNQISQIEGNIYDYVDLYRLDSKDLPF